jgi:hypothetical protein
MSLWPGCGFRHSGGRGAETGGPPAARGSLAVADLVGKAPRPAVPVPEWAKLRVDAWVKSASVTSGSP